MTTSCDKSFFDNKGSWFYFNQPINQIEGYVANQPQILMHGPNKGLLWKTVECSHVVNCISLGAQELVIEQSQIIVIRDNGPIPDCINIPLTSCSGAESSSSSSGG